MSILNQKRGGLVLIGGPQHAASHRIRLVCHAKDLTEIDYEYVDPLAQPDELQEINPTGRLPILIDKDLILIDERVIGEYLDERFPHPALMPIEAGQKALIRLFCYELESKCYSILKLLEQEKLTAAKKKTAIAEIRDSVLHMLPFFKGRQFVMGNELSLLDCCLLPILWRFESLGIELPKVAAPLEKYMQTHFASDFFRKSLTPAEKALRASS